MTSDVTWGTIWWGLVYAKRCWQQAWLTAGHSLGGALANLCAFDIAAAIKEAGATGERRSPSQCLVTPLGHPGLATPPSALSTMHWCRKAGLSSMTRCLLVMLAFVLAHNTTAVAQEWARPF